MTASAQTSRVVAIAAVAVILAAVAVGLGLGDLLPSGASVGEPGDSIGHSPSPSAKAEATPLPTRAPTATASGALYPGGAVTCENVSIGFVVSYPADWWANEEIEPVDPGPSPIPACVYFAEEPVDLMPNAGLPPGIAITVGLEEQPVGDPQQPTEVLSSRDVTVAGVPATVEEIIWTEHTVFQRAGDRSYAYRISLPSGATLLVGTLNQQPSEQYELRKAVLDAMMTTLQLTAN